jgi:hypothetical protein
MPTTFEARQIKIRALHDDVIVCDMDFGEIRLNSGIILRSDDGKSHGIKPRWGKVYKVGPEQKDITEGQWILIEHGRWSRKIKINDGDSEKEIQKIDVNCILAVSDEKPNESDVYVGDSV